MEVYILDSLLRRTAVVDRFQSLIWTERYQQMGDFKLVVTSTPDSRKLFVEDTVLAINESYRMMVVENIENKSGSDGKKILTITGRSFELLLENRAARVSWDDTEETPTWNLTDKPADIARTIFQEVCVDGDLATGDIIPYITPGSVFPVDTIGEPNEEVTLQIGLKTVYQAIKDICDLWDLGFRLVRDLETTALYFDIYTGSDRTTAQSTLNPVIFSQNLDNLTNTTELTSVEKAKNCAYVFSPIGTKLVYADGTTDSTSGFSRKALLVDASDLTEATDVQAALEQRGLEALKEYRSFQAFDGEINQNSQYKYGVDYNLGDLIEIRNSEGFTNNMRVTEQIFASDSEGERSYPTLTVNTSITPGSWIAWDYNQVWEDLGETEYWEDQR